MSVQQLAAVFERSGSRNGARLVLLSIANHDGDGGSWPTISTISRESGLTERSVHEALRRLQDDGELKVHPNAGGTMDWRNDRRPNRYQIVLPDGVEDIATSSTHGVEDSSERGGSLPRHGVEDIATQTIQEPSTEPSMRKRVDELFAQFWAAYPKRTERVRALAVFERVVMKAPKGQRHIQARAIIAGAQRYAKTCEGVDKQYIKGPAGWLRDGRWEDEASTEMTDQEKLIAEYNSVTYT